MKMTPRLNRLDSHFDELKSGAEDRRNAYFFQDNRRQIDFILAYEREGGGGGGGGGGGLEGEKEEDGEEADEKEELLGEKEAKDNEARRVKSKEDKWRNKFLKNLARRGLEMEEDMSEGEKKDTVFIKVHAPFEVLCR